MKEVRRAEPKPRPSTVRVVFDWALGLTLLAIGVVAGPIPILQGWPFFLAGLAVLSSHSRLARVILERMKGAGRKVRDSIRQRREASRARRGR